MKNRLSSRLRLTLSGVTLLTLLLMCVLVFAGMYFQTTADNREQLRQQAVQLSAYLEASDDPVSLLQGSVFTQRVTYLDTDGTVLYDSEVDASRLESHAGREEFQQARENGEAFTARSSATLGQTSLYYAKRLADGRVIRVSGTQRGMLRQVRDLLGYLLLGAVLCFGAAMAFSRPLAKRLAAPMNEVNLDQPLESDVYEELSPMLRRMAQQNMRIADQMASLTAQRHELDTVLGGMKEGFVILDEKRHVLTMNNAARAMFCISNDPVGQPMIAVSRDEALLRLLDGQGTECAMQLNGMTIHLSRSHVEGGGTALLMQDVTAAQAAEASRRQFSANVSHELRTPLTTISGYAELLSSGMLQKPEDATEFGRKILAESRRLLTLIEDIIRLSRLDEGVRSEVTPVDLTALIQHCVQKLTPAAQNAHRTPQHHKADGNVRNIVKALQHILAVQRAIGQHQQPGPQQAAVLELCTVPEPEPRREIQKDQHHAAHHAHSMPAGEQPEQRCHDQLGVEHPQLGGIVPVGAHHAALLRQQVGKQLFGRHVGVQPVGCPAAPVYHQQGKADRRPEQQYHIGGSFLFCAVCLQLWQAAPLPFLG